MSIKIHTAYRVRHGADPWPLLWATLDIVTWHGFGEVSPLRDLAAEYLERL